MNEYHKIQTVYKRDPDNRLKTLLIGEYALPEFAYLRENQWLFTEKVDGTNVRVMLKAGGGLWFGGKTDNAQIPPQLFESLMNMFNVNQMREHFPDGVCLYGEGYGAKIQKGGGNYRPDQSFVLFDVKVDGWWLLREDVEDVAQKLGIDVVPTIGHGSLDGMVAIARGGLKSAWGDFQAEGVVARPATELRTRRGDRIITKIKCKDFPG